MRIGIDIDDTITNSYNKILEELQKEYGINRFDYINQGKTYYDIEQQNKDSLVMTNSVQIILKEY